jgi:hypothetical protein
MTLSVIVLVLGMTVASILAVLFTSTLVTILTVAGMSTITGFVCGLGVSMRIQMQEAKNWKMLEEALNRKQHSDQVIQATIINKMVVRGGDYEPDKEFAWSGSTTASTKGPESGS